MKCMYKIIPVLAVVLPMLYCIQGCTSSEKTTAPEGLVEGSVGIAADLSMKADPDDIGPLRFRMQAWTTGSERGPELAFDFTWYSSTGSVKEPVRMIPGTYDILFWADRQPENKPEELYYDTESLKSVNVVNPYARGEEREAFSGVLKGQEFISGTDLTVTLSRPLAKLMIKAPDGKKISGVRYDSLLLTFDVYKGSASSEQPVSCKPGANEFTDYVFPGAMTVTIKYGSNETRTVGLNAETLKANYITNITISE